MDPKYGLYTVADSHWYEPLERCDDTVSRFSLTKRQLPVDWKRSQHGFWETFTPTGGSKLPDQGWKVPSPPLPIQPRKPLSGPGQCVGS